MIHKFGTRLNVLGTEGQEHASLPQHIEDGPAEHASHNVTKKMLDWGTYELLTITYYLFTMACKSDCSALKAAEGLV